MTVYASLGLRRGIPELLWAFRKKYVLQEFPVYLDDHPFQLYERMKEEENFGIRTADVVLQPHYMMLRLKREGMLVPYSPAEIETFPVSFRDKESYWFALGVTFMTLAYNSRKIPKRSLLPSSLEELTEGRWKNRLGMQSLTSSSVGNLGAQYISFIRRTVGEERWLAFINKLNSMQVITFDCIDHLVQGVLDNQIDIALTVYSLAYFRERLSRSPIKSFEIEDVPRMLTFTSAGLTKSAENNESARLFLDFLSSNEAQRIVGTIPGISPGRNGVRTTYDFEAKYSAIRSKFHPDGEDLRQLPDNIETYRKIGLP